MRSRFRWWLARALFGDLIYEAANRRERFVRSCIHSDGWWFSHDEPTMRVIQSLANGEDTWTVRDRWHKETEKGRPGIDKPREEPA